MGRPVERLVELRDTLRAASDGLLAASEQIMIIAAVLDPQASVNKTAQEPEAPPADDPGGGDPFDEPVTGEEGGDMGGDMGDMGGGMGDMGGGMGGGMGGDMGGGMGGDMGGGMGGGMGAPPLGGPGGEAPPSAEDTETRARIDGLTTQLDGLRRELIDVAQVLRDIRNPLADDTKGNDAFQSV